jgi:hypothetical protein
VLEEAGAARSEAELAEIESVVRDLCAEAAAPDAPKPAPKTFGDVAALLFEKHIRDGNRPRTLKKDKFYLSVLGPRLARVPVAEMTTRIADAAMALVPPSVEASRNLYEGFIYRVMKYAVRLELIPANPLRSDFVSKQQPPKRLFQYLRVAEDAALIACGAAPLEERIGYALMDREGVRPELLSLFYWSDRADPNARVSTIDLESGLLTHRHKQKRVRRWLVCERVLRVLRRWRELNPDTDRVLPHWDHRNVSARLRKHLLAAGVNRISLHRSTATERQIAAKDAGRATFVTLALRAGAPMHWVTDRTGHATDEMVERYTRMAREGRDTERAWLRALDELLGPELGLEPLTDRYVAPWLQGLPVAAAEQSATLLGADLGQSLGHLIEILKQSGNFGQMPSTMLYSAPSPEHSRQAPKDAPASPSTGTDRIAGPAENVGVGHAGPVDLALAAALEAATKAQRWDVVLAVAAELRERRLERSAPDVPSLDAARAKRNGGKS